MRALHDEAAARGVTTVWLEVMEQNDAAFRLYEKLGYRIVREVEVWSLPAGEADGSAREVSAGQARARLRELGREREPWQRADGTLEHYDDLRGLESDGAPRCSVSPASFSCFRSAGTTPRACCRRFAATAP